MLVTKLYIGLNDKDTKKQCFSDHIMDSQIRTILRDHGIAIQYKAQLEFIRITMD